MALYKVALRKAHDVTWPQRRKWSTTFYVSAESAVSAATTIVNAWDDHLKGATRNNVFAYEVYATSVTEGDADYNIQTVPAGIQRGTAGAGSGELYRPDVCVSVTIPVAGSRPSRKFWRWGLTEGDISNGVALGGGIPEAIAGAFNAMLTELSGVLVDPDGQALQSGVVLRLTRRSFGRLAGLNLPEPPAVG
jgi:hypothetical protein